MIRRSIPWMLFVLAVLSLGTIPAFADLYLRGTDSLGNQLIYDDDLDITWYDYTNRDLPWTYQDAWAESLTVDYEGVIYNDWRLPTGRDTRYLSETVGYGSYGELGHLYYAELGNVADYSYNIPLNTSFVDGLSGSEESFLHLQSDSYWTGTVSSYYTFDAYYYNLSGGLQYVSYRLVSQYANMYLGIAVRSGDVPAQVVPNPGAFFLCILGLCAAGMKLRKRRELKGSCREF